MSELQPIQNGKSAANIPVGEILVALALRRADQSKGARAVRSGVRASFLESCAMAKNGVVDRKKDHRAHHSYQDAVDVHSGDAGHSKRLKQETTHDGADDAQRDVQQRAFTRFVDDLAGYESS
jgi:hypothetical protein